ncbi:MAG: class I SAM-dependent methyltransferase [Mariprofundaceae bacterium]
MSNHQHPKELGLAFLQELFRDYHPRDFSVTFWDGSSWDPGPNHKPHFTLHLNNPASVFSMFWPPTELNLAESYIFEDFDLEGDVEASYKAFDYLKGLYREPGRWLHLGRMLYQLPRPEKSSPRHGPARFGGRRHSLSRDQQAIRYHYNVSNAFYALWLESRMVYSCAFFQSPGDDLDTAQEQKLDYICRKLCLQQGESLLDIGCGWGGLIIHAVRHYGVKALGITLSDQQARYAREQIRAAGLEDQCRVEILDYRAMDEPESFDKLVSVGMFEHVGESQLALYFQQAWMLLKPGGLFLNQGIARTVKDPVKKVSPFIDRYVFPDSELSLISTTNGQAERSGFEVRDVENLREHYTLTLRHWIRRLEAHHAEAILAADEATFRVWRLYMAGSAQRFAKGYLNLYQSLFSKQTPEGKSCLPLNRQVWHENAEKSGPEGPPVKNKISLDRD